MCLSHPTPISAEATTAAPRTVTVLPGGETEVHFTMTRERGDR